LPPIKNRHLDGGDFLTLRLVAYLLGQRLEAPSADLDLHAGQSSGLQVGVLLLFGGYVGVTTVVGAVGSAAAGVASSGHISDDFSVNGGRLSCSSGPGKTGPFLRRWGGS